MPDGIVLGERSEMFCFLQCRGQQVLGKDVQGRFFPIFHVFFFLFFLSFP